jgi:hypothetical protein
VNGVKKYVVFFVVFVLISVNALADMIYLKDGKVLDAYIVERTSAYVIVNDGTRNIKIPTANLKGIKKKIQENFPVGTPTPASSSGGAVMTAAGEPNVQNGPSFKLVPSDDEHKIAEYEGYIGLSAIEPEVEKMSNEMSQMKVIMGMELVLIAVGVVVVFVKK